MIRDGSGLFRFRNFLGFVLKAIRARHPLPVIRPAAPFVFRQAADTVAVEIHRDEVTKGAHEFTSASFFPSSIAKPLTVRLSSHAPSSSSSAAICQSLSASVHLRASASR